MKRKRITLDERAAKIAKVLDQIDVRLDANETMMFSRQLEAIEQRLYEVKYPDGHAIELIPLNTSIDPGALTYTYRVQDYAGEAKRVSNWATDFPRVDMQGFEVSHKLQNYGISFGYNLQQLRSAKFANFALEQNLNASARRIVMRKLNDNLWFGDSSIGVTGLANNANVSPTAVITGAWASASADEMLADLQKLISASTNNSKGVEKTTAVALPVSLFTLISTTFMGTSAPGVTVLDMAKKANPGVAFYSSNSLETADAGGTGPRIVAFDSDSEKLEGLVPVEFEVLPAINQGGEFEVKCMGRFGGVALRYPGSVNVMDDC